MSIFKILLNPQISKITKVCCMAAARSSFLLDCANVINHCPKLARSVDSEHEDIFSGDTKKQRDIAELYLSVYETKRKLVDKSIF